MELHGNLLVFLFGHDADIWQTSTAACIGAL